jgi:hypothetical protein
MIAVQAATFMGPAGMLCLQMSDEPSKLGTHYSIGQREYFKHVVSALHCLRTKSNAAAPPSGFVLHTTASVA